ncbi:unnamed protein product [Miscanthus lutarioriparius]|uniref:MRN complex-interacting protein N-terminal domain-containing protein n=1 Tax=Miscanthus lutarioriparius TaxID=422564 RepID=A0A811P5K3_9POAL|nr:unnamed protein product [Miscanthus lutarioriparius]
METRLFLALQCVQCATMQVKQQKKSNNKWVCVVCNQRQSVLHVHARGYRAADLRRFVQDANLARGRREFAPLAEPDVGWDPAAVEEQGDVLPIEKRQTEWSEYLDDLGEPGNGRGGLGADASDGESGEGIEVITELPQKRPKVRPLKAQSDVVGKRTKLSTHPTLYNKRQQIKQGSSPRCATTTAEVQRSKWSRYLDTSLFGERKGSDTPGLRWTEHDEYASTEATTDVVVEDEVHPDFI